MDAGTADLPGKWERQSDFYGYARRGKIRVAAALELERWDEELGMVGETMTFREVVGAVEKVTKRTLLVKEKL